MNRSPLHRAARSGLSTATLALFLLGNNYCLLGALSVGGNHAPSCHAMARPAAPSASPCCHGGKGPARGAPAARPGMPCCMLLATPSVIQIEKAPVTTHASLPEPSVASGGSGSTLSSWVGVRLVHSSPRAPSVARAPQAPRAPPLS